MRDQDLHEIFDEAPQGVALAGQDALIRYCNRRFCDMLGYSEAEIISLGLRGITDPLDWEKDCECGLRLLRGEIPSYVLEKRYVCKDGRTVWGSLNASMIREADGAPTAILGVVEDITERKRAEEALRESETRFRSLFQDSAVGMVVVTPENEFIQVNKAFCEFLGYSQEELLGMTIESITYPDDWAASAAAIRQALNCGPRLHRLEKRYLHKNGELRWGEVTSSLVCDAQGRPKHFVTQVLDITQRKWAEESLQKAREELERRVAERTAELAKANDDLAIFHEFAQASSQGFGMADLAGRLVYVNPALCRLFGEDDPANALGKHVASYYGDEYLVRREKEILPALRQTGHWQGEMTVRSPRGPLVSILQSMFVIRDEKGAPVRLAGVVTDITERKRAAEAWRQNRDELQAIYDGTVDGLLVVDVETTRFVRANSAISRMLGHSEPELLSMSVRDIHPAEAMELVSQQFRSLAEGQTRVAEGVPVLRKDGSIFYADISANNIVYNGRPCLIAFFRDITERKNSEEALRRSEERFRSYFVQALIGMAVTRIDRQWQEVNDRLCDILGYSRDELLAMKWTDVTHPDDLESGQLQFTRLLAGEFDHYTQDKRFFRKDGEIVYARVFIRCFRHVDGTADHILALIEDITERKRAAEALEREKRTLKHLLQSSDHERQLIAYEIHDGLAQQLAGAVMQFEAFSYLQETKPKRAADAFHAGMTMLRQGHFEARRLISGVRPPILDDAGIVAAVSHLVNEERSQKGPKIEYASDVEFERLSPILENAIYRIIQEGLNNACRHSKSDKVRVELVQQGERVRIEVQDRGVGFKAEDVGESHFGVAGIRERARLLGGQAIIDSKPGVGTRIVVNLPLVQTSEADES